MAGNEGTAVGVHQEVFLKQIFDDSDDGDPDEEFGTFPSRKLYKMVTTENYDLVEFSEMMAICNCNWRSRDSRETIWLKACRLGYLEIVKILWNERFVHVDAKGTSRKFELERQFANQNAKQLHVNVATRDHNGHDCLMHAASNGWLSIICFLMGETRSIDMTHDNSETREQKVKMHERVENLLSSKCKAGQNFLMLAAANGHLHILWYFYERHHFKNKVSIDEVDKLGNTALMLAIAGGHLNCVQFLIEVLEADLTFVNPQNGKTVFHVAFQFHRRKILQYLIQRYVELEYVHIRAQELDKITHDPVTRKIQYDDLLLSKQCKEGKRIHYKIHTVAELLDEGDFHTVIPQLDRDSKNVLENTVALNQAVERKLLHEKRKLDVVNEDFPRPVMRFTTCTMVYDTFQNALVISRKLERELRKMRREIQRAQDELRDATEKRDQQLVRECKEDIARLEQAIKRAERWMNFTEFAQQYAELGMACSCLTINDVNPIKVNRKGSVFDLLEEALDRSTKNYRKRRTTAKYIMRSVLYSFSIPEARIPLRAGDIVKIMLDEKEAGDNSDDEEEDGAGDHKTFAIRLGRIVGWTEEHQEEVGGIIKNNEIVETSPINSFQITLYFKREKSGEFSLLRDTVMGTHGDTVRHYIAMLSEELEIAFRVTFETFDQEQKGRRSNKCMVTVVHEKIHKTTEQIMARLASIPPIFLSHVLGVNRVEVPKRMKQISESAKFAIDRSYMRVLQLTDAPVKPKRIHIRDASEYKFEELINLPEIKNIIRRCLMQYSGERKVDLNSDWAKFLRATVQIAHRRYVEDELSKHRKFTTEVKSLFGPSSTSYAVELARLALIKRVSALSVGSNRDEANMSFATRADKLRDCIAKFEEARAIFREDHSSSGESELFVLQHLLWTLVELKETLSVVNDTTNAEERKEELLRLEKNILERKDERDLVMINLYGRRNMKRGAIMAAYMIHYPTLREKVAITPFNFVNGVLGIHIYLRKLFSTAHEEDAKMFDMKYAREEWRARGRKQQQKKRRRRTSMMQPDAEIDAEAQFWRRWACGEKDGGENLIAEAVHALADPVMFLQRVRDLMYEDFLDREDQSESPWRTFLLKQGEKTKKQLYREQIYNEQVDVFRSNLKQMAHEYRSLSTMWGHYIRAHLTWSRLHQLQKLAIESENSKQFNSRRQEMYERMQQTLSAMKNAQWRESYSDKMLVNIVGPVVNELRALHGKSIDTLFPSVDIKKYLRPKLKKKQYEAVLVLVTSLLDIVSQSNSTINEETVRKELLMHHDMCRGLLRVARRKHETKFIDSLRDLSEAEYVQYQQSLEATLTCTNASQAVAARKKAMTSLEKAYIVDPRPEKEVRYMVEEYVKLCNEILGPDGDYESKITRDRNKLLTFGEIPDWANAYNVRRYQEKLGLRQGRHLSLDEADRMVKWTNEDVLDWMSYIDEEARLQEIEALAARAEAKERQAAAGALEERGRQFFPAPSSTVGRDSKVSEGFVPQSKRVSRDILAVLRGKIVNEDGNQVLINGLYLIICTESRKWKSLLSNREDVEYIESLVRNKLRAEAMRNKFKKIRRSPVKYPSRDREPVPEEPEQLSFFARIFSCGNTRLARKPPSLNAKSSFRNLSDDLNPEDISGESSLEGADSSYDSQDDSEYSSESPDDSNGED